MQSKSEFKSAAEAKTVSMDEVIATLRLQEDSVKQDNPYSSGAKDGEWYFQPPAGADSREIALAKAHNACLLAQKMKETGVEFYELHSEDNLADDIHGSVNLKTRILAKSALKVSNP